MNKVLIVVDMQNDFVNGTLGTSEAVGIVPKVKSKIEKYIGYGMDIIFTMDTHTQDCFNKDDGNKFLVKHCVRGTEGWQIIPELKEYTEGNKVRIVEKSEFGSVKLSKLVEKYDEIEIVGLCTDICVISNAIFLSVCFPEKLISVDAACCAGVTPNSHNNALSVMKMCQIDVLNENISVCPELTGDKKICGNVSNQLLYRHKTQKRYKVVNEWIQCSKLQPYISKMHLKVWYNRYRNDKHIIYMQTFGNFEMFIDNEPVKFPRSKSKELIAFLVDRKGAGVSSAEIAGVLWEDKIYNRSLKNQVQTIVGAMMDTLKSYGVEDIVIKKWNSLSIDTTKILCDYYKFLQGDKDYINRFAGEYMSNYSWSEFTTGYLTEIAYKR